MVSHKLIKYQRENRVEIIFQVFLVPMTTMTVRWSQGYNKANLLSSGQCVATFRLSRYSAADKLRRRTKRGV